MPPGRRKEKYKYHVLPQQFVCSDFPRHVLQRIFSCSACDDFRDSKLQSRGFQQRETLTQRKQCRREALGLRPIRVRVRICTDSNEISPLAQLPLRCEAAKASGTAGDKVAAEAATAAWKQDDEAAKSSEIAKRKQD